MNTTDDITEAPVVTPGKEPDTTAPARPRRWWLAGLVSALVVGAGALYLVNQRHDDVDDAARQAQATGVGHIEEILSYDYRGIDQELDGERAWLTDDFASSYEPLISDTFGPAAEKAKLVTEATVVAGGIEEAESGHVVLVVFVNVSVQQQDQQPQVTGSRLRVELDDVDGDWLISAIDPI